MTPPFEFALAIALPVAAFYSVIGGGRLLKWLAERETPVHLPQPIQRVSADLVRLRAELEAMETRDDLPAKNLRLRALRAAYVDALYEACRRLEVSPPNGGWPRPESIRQSDIYRIEAALRERGIDVREMAGR